MKAVAFESPDRLNFRSRIAEEALGATVPTDNQVFEAGTHNGIVSGIDDERQVSTEVRGRPYKTLLSMVAVFASGKPGS